MNKELQILHDLMEKAQSGLEEIRRELKEQSESKPEFKAGDWVVQEDYIGRIGAIQDYKLFIPSCGTYFWINANNCRHATNEEITNHLEKEAVKRGFKVGTMFESPLTGEHFLLVAFDPKYFHRDNGGQVFRLDDGGTIWIDGKWATIVDDIPEINGHKMEVTAFGYVKIGCIEKYSKSVQRIDESVDIFNKSTGCQITGLQINGKYEISVEQLKSIVEHLNKK
jgi:hypothetical protein